MSISSNYIFEVTSDPAAIKQSFINNSESFNLPNRNLASVTDYVNGELAINDSDICQRRSPTISIQGQVFYVVRDTSITLAEGDFTSDIVASCCTLTRDGYVKSPTFGLKNIPVSCYAFVYTKPDQRRKGVAAFMLNEVNRHMEREIPDGISVLYSDVGEYYSRFGFESRHVPLALLLVAAILQTPSVEGGKIITHMQGQFKDLFILDDRILVERLNSSLTEAPYKISVSLKPDSAIQELFASRSTWKYSKSKSINQALEDLIFGISVTDEATGQVLGFVTFSHYWNAKVMSVTRLFISPSAEKAGTAKTIFVQLVQNLAVLAEKLEFDTIKLWHSEIDETKHKAIWDWIDELPNSDINLANTSLSAINFHSGFKAKYDVEGPDVKWEMNGKWCWY
ncbi:hypothetical protein BABINDRAFT_162836 [Babjeviella inositovora NRRL Y-12698]|uniref:LYC1 C-terminal domain-containing protein n=1 Tax=Babjeviella inositovora NRRL Y-12698 TaxID=984486 RepID=A0A1E3QL26_9ASCO|nr:uncharacterized protein BABINDRAFT_162836 [Babjeviella inositovora NRRL Y-12698]ODQ78164.1 hypothetical protein BABINDRAFT_162836 [Babjeviella inositovora NRRL Y-12698]